MNSLLRPVTLTCLFLVLILVEATDPNDPGYKGSLLPPAAHMLKEKVTGLHFYVHNMICGPTRTVMPVAGPMTEPGFGSVFVMNDPLTQGPELNSKLLGRAQGLYAFVEDKGMSMVTAVNYVFLEGMYKGSSLSIMGRSDALDGVRELPVVGGSGLFRLARGYALAKTLLLNLTNGNTIIEYDVFVIHY
ncbi:Dirigent protein 21 [Nymphaea thermarum]|nr:Dirigent protein 21 [Nymphaea thermarum]